MGRTRPLARLIGRAGAPGRGRRDRGTTNSGSRGSISPRGAPARGPDPRRGPGAGQAGAARGDRRPRSDAFKNERERDEEDGPTRRRHPNAPPRGSFRSSSTTCRPGRREGAFARARGAGLGDGSLRCIAAATGAVVLGGRPGRPNVKGAKRDAAPSARARRAGGAAAAAKVGRALDRVPRPLPSVCAPCAVARRGPVARTGRTRALASGPPLIPSPAPALGTRPRSRSRAAVPLGRRDKTRGRTREGRQGFVARGHQPAH
jgi:hypothetical protein